MFIALEGIDAAGKRTQSELLAEVLGAKLFSFPDYSTPMGHLIKGHLEQYWEAAPMSAAGVDEVGDVGKLNALVFQSLQLTNRMEHATALHEALGDDDDGHVVADRYWPSGWVYGIADGLDPEWIMRIHATLPSPDLYLLLDVSPEHSVERRPERRDRYEQQEGLMEKVTHLYRRLWREQDADENNDGNWVVINGRDTIDGVHRQIIEAVEEADD